ncbi:hypothetical protein BJF90_09135 [Pseudonocardia sp. CNS-004]|nr:hypothetical protein BJF90_09135 [Pseudonocardia sp. CNS-004]
MRLRSSSSVSSASPPSSSSSTVLADFFLSLRSTGTTFFPSFFAEAFFASLPDFRSAGPAFFPVFFADAFFSTRSPESLTFFTFLPTLSSDLSPLAF